MRFDADRVEAAARPAPLPSFRIIPGSDQHQCGETSGGERDVAGGAFPADTRMVGGLRAELAESMHGGTNDPEGRDDMVRLLGVHQKQIPKSTAQEFAGHRGTRIFVADVIRPQDLVKKMKIQCADTWAAGQVAVWSFKPHPADVKNGKWRKPIEDLARYLKANPKNKTALVIWHEPENDIPQWFKKPEDFVTMFNTVHGWIVAIHPDAWTCHAALAYKYGIKKGGITDADAKRWRTKARVNGIDVYSGRTWPLNLILPEHPGYVRWRRFVAPAGMWGVIERGWTCQPKDNKLRAQTMDREFAWLKSLPKGQRPVVYLVWSTSGTENDQGLVLDAQGKASVKKGFSGVYKAPPY